MNSATDAVSFSEAVVSGLSRVVLADVVVFQALDRIAQRIMTHMSPPAFFTPDEVAYYASHSGEHPLASHFAASTDPSARRVSDLVDEAVWLASDLYRTCLARTSLVYSLGLPVNVDDSVVVALSFSRRERDFTEQDCRLLDAFGPHLRLAWKRHRSPWADRRELESRQRLQAMGLSTREAEVLFWMTEGKLNREIATLLGVSIHTVQEHVSNILSKLHMENRHAATVFAISQIH